MGTAIIRPILLLGLSMGLCTSGCAEDARVRTIAVTRDLDVAERPFRWRATSSERFGFAAFGVPGGGSSGAHTEPSLPGQPPGTRSSSAAGMAWDVPAGWRRGPDRPMRVVTFLTDEGGASECYVTLLAGDGGGALANANRWLGQMGRSPLTPDAFAALERVPMLGGEGILLEAVGSFTGMGDQDVPDAMLLGTICLLPGEAVFVKLTGPRAHVESQRAEFLAFCLSLHGAD